MGSSDRSRVRPKTFVAAVAPLVAVPDSSVGLETSTQLVLVDNADGELARRAADSGMGTILLEGETLESAVGLALAQALELQKLRTTYGRVRLLERAKGILMERHRVSERRAYELLHRHARNSNLRLSEVAEAVVESHLVLVGASDQPAPSA